MNQESHLGETESVLTEPPLDPPLDYSRSTQTQLVTGLLHAPEQMQPAATALPPKHGSALSFPVSQQPDAFRKRHFPQVSRQQWSDWHWQLAQRVTASAQLERLLELNAQERQACAPGPQALPLAVTPYYLSLMHPKEPMHPLRRCMVPSLQELETGPGERADPLEEERDTVAPGLVHRYPDRVLFLATDFCAAYCRYCTRSRLVGRRQGSALRSRWQAALDYIAASPTVRDVIISGGDPLTMPDNALEWLLSALRRIPHVEVLRIGTKIPAVLPQRITRQLTRLLKKFHPLWLSLHCTHPLELTPEMATACARLVDAGIPLGSQTVLLKGVNDAVPTLRELFTGLMRLRVRPYYLYQCDPVPGSRHFRTPVSQGLELLNGLRGHISGYAVPNFVVDAPGGGGKIPLLSDAIEGHDKQGSLLLRNYEGKTFTYPDIL